jgi:hypothetical protein
LIVNIEPFSGSQVLTSISNTMATSDAFVGLHEEERSLDADFTSTTVSPEFIS